MRVQLSDFDHISYARMMDLYKERYADASDFIFTFVGNVDTDAIKPLIEQYLATLPSLGRKEPKGREDVYAHMQKGITEKRFARSMETPKASIVGIYSGQLDFTPENMTLLTALKQILDIVYVEKSGKKPVERMASAFLHSWVISRKERSLCKHISIRTQRRLI